MFLSIVRDFWFCPKFYKKKYQKIINKNIDREKNQSHITRLYMKNSYNKKYRRKFPNN